MKTGFINLHKGEKGLYHWSSNDHGEHRVELGRLIETPAVPSIKEDPWEDLFVYSTYAQGIYALIEGWSDQRTLPDDCEKRLCECEYDSRPGSKADETFEWYGRRYPMTCRSPKRIRVRHEIPMRQILAAKVFPKGWVEQKGGVKRKRRALLSMTLLTFSVRGDAHPGDADATICSSLTGDELVSLRGLSAEVAKIIFERVYDEWAGRDLELLEWLEKGKRGAE